MADKRIVDLPALRAVTDDTLIPVYQPGAENPAQRMSGKQFKEFGEGAVSQYAEIASNAASAAQSAYSGVQAALNNLPYGDTLIINDLTTGGTKAALSAEQGRILGERPATNANLLDNWYFADPINQRGQTEYTGAVYSIDRWAGLNSSLKVSLADTGIMCENIGTSVTFFKQNIKNQSKVLGNVVTLSCLLSDGTFVTGTGTPVLPSSGTSYIPNISLGSDGNFLAIRMTPGTAAVAFRLGAGTSLNAPIVAVKLELGSQQTLAHQDKNGNWVLNDPPPDKGLELLKCCMSTTDSSDTYANNKRTARSVGAISNDGGELSGYLTFQMVDNGSGSLVKSHAPSADYGMILQDNDADGDFVRLQLRAARQAAKLTFSENGAESQYDILHTGNKPSGSYTGNGDATSRTLEIGALGRVVAIWSNNGSVLIVNAVGFGRANDGLKEISGGNVFVGSTGNLVLSTTNSLLNASGVTYNYQVL